LVDALSSGGSVRKDVLVRIQSRAHNTIKAIFKKIAFFIFIVLETPDRIYFLTGLSESYLKSLKRK
jgi:hypothetical protein